MRKSHITWESHISHEKVTYHMGKYSWVLLFGLLLEILIRLLVYDSILPRLYPQGAQAELSSDLRRRALPSAVPSGGAGWTQLPPQAASVAFWCSLGWRLLHSTVALGGLLHSVVPSGGPASLSCTPIRQRQFAFPRMCARSSLTVDNNI